MLTLRLRLSKEGTDADMDEASQERTMAAQGGYLSLIFSSRSRQVASFGIVKLVVDRRRGVVVASSNATATGMTRPE